MTELLWHPERPAVLTYSIRVGQSWRGSRVGRRGTQQPAWQRRSQMCPTCCCYCLECTRLPVCRSGTNPRDGQSATIHPTRLFERDSTHKQQAMSSSKHPRAAVAPPTTSSRVNFATLEIRWHDQGPIFSCDLQPYQAESQRKHRNPYQRTAENATDYDGKLWRLATAGGDHKVRVGVTSRLDSSLAGWSKG